MSVLIKGMKMPKNCDECDAYICYRTWSGDPGDKFCGLTKNDIQSQDIPYWCPLVKLPEKHGRLIDADEFGNRMHGKWTVYDYEALGRMPTVIEAEAET